MIILYKISIYNIYLPTFRSSCDFMVKYQHHNKCKKIFISITKQCLTLILYRYIISTNIQQHLSYSYTITHIFCVILLQKTFLYNSNKMENKINLIYSEKNNPFVKQARIQGGGIWGTCPPLEPNAQRKNLRRLKDLRGQIQQKSPKFSKWIIFFS